MKTIGRSFKFIALIVLFTYFTVNLEAQNKYILEYKDGRKIEGTVKKFNEIIKTIKIKDKNNKKIKVKSDDLKSVTLLNKKDTVVFKRYKYSIINGFYKIKNKKKLLWLTKFYDSNELEGYWGYLEFNVFGNSKMGLTSRKHGSYNYYIKRKKDKRPIQFAQATSESDPFHAYDNIMRRKFKKLVEKRCPKFGKVLKKKKYKLEDIESMFNDYNSMCEKK